jgi:hypothetical protein
MFRQPSPTIKWSIDFVSWFLFVLILQTIKRRSSGFAFYNPLKIAIVSREDLMRLMDNRYKASYKSIDRNGQYFCDGLSGKILS